MKTSGTRELDLPLYVTKECDICKGRGGYVDRTAIYMTAKKCNKCEGTGKIKVEDLPKLELEDDL